MQRQHSPEEAQQACEVMAALSSYREQIEHIMGLLENKSVVTRPEKEDLQDLLRTLKERLRLSAKTGTVNGHNRTQNSFERSYFAPAIRKASAYLGVAVNSHPIRSNWFSALYSTRVDIAYPLHQLESQFPERE